MSISSTVDVPLLFSLWGSRMRNDEIASALGITPKQLSRVARRYALCHRGKAKESVTDDPTQEEIAERAAEVRRGWSPDEEVRRRGGVRATWNPPAFAFHNKTTSFQSIGNPI